MGLDFSRFPCVSLASGQLRCQHKCVTGSETILNGATLHPGHQLTGMRMLFLRNSIRFHHGNFECLRRQLAGLSRDCVRSASHPSTPPGSAWPVVGREEGEPWLWESEWPCLVGFTSAGTVSRGWQGWAPPSGLCVLDSELFSSQCS